FTMELLDGSDFVRFVRRDAGDGSAAELTTDGIVRAVAGRGQLVDAVATIHAAGMLHRDIKPSNVMVCSSEAGEHHRVVLLDFGLMTPVELGATPSSRRQLAGTPARMPPEQLWGEALGPSSDWYGVGMLLYEA